MLKAIKTLPILLCYMLPIHISAQQPLSLEECLKQGIEANYSVKIARNDELIAEKNLVITPFLPTLTLNAGQDRDDMKSTDYYKSQANEHKDYIANQYEADATLKWRLFDGMSMFASYETQRQLLEQGKLNLRAELENLIADLSQQYYYIISQENRLDAITTYLEISTMRYSQALEKYSIGSISGLEMKQAQIDMNSDSSNLVLQQQIIENAYIQLYEMMNVSFTSDMHLIDSIIPDKELFLDNLIDQAKQNNVEILLAQTGQRITYQNIRQARSGIFPNLDFNSSYRFSRSDNTASQPLYNRSNGFNFGFSLSWTIFNGLETTRKLKTAKLQHENAEWRRQQIEYSIESNIIQQYNIYRKNLMMINFENESTAAALANLEAAVERYRLGTLSGIAFREIQKGYIDAIDRQLNAVYQAKISEISLLYLSGTLM